jgi:hypothetical protein
MAAPSHKRAEEDDGIPVPAFTAHLRYEAERRPCVLGRPYNTEYGKSVESRKWLAYLPRGEITCLLWARCDRIAHQNGCLTAWPHNEVLRSWTRVSNLSRLAVEGVERLSRLRRCLLIQHPSEYGGHDISSRFNPPSGPHHGTSVNCPRWKVMVDSVMCDSCTPDTLAQLHLPVLGHRLSRKSKSLLLGPADIRYNAQSPKINTLRRKQRSGLAY